MAYKSPKVGSNLPLWVSLLLALSLSIPNTWAQAQRSTAETALLAENVIQLQKNVSRSATLAGVKVAIDSISIQGNSVFSEAALLTTLGHVKGVSYDMAGLQDLANTITNHYRTAGFLFASAYLPPQSVSGGTIIIKVLEGRYGSITAAGEGSIAQSAQAYLHVLEAGAVITQAKLTRAVLILGDVPSVIAKPVLRLGSEVNTADLEVMVSEARNWDGSFTVDNHSSRYNAGVNGRLSLGFNDVLNFGDRLSLLWDNSLRGGTYGDSTTYEVGYGFALGSDGLLGKALMSQSSYQLGYEFMGFSGSSKALLVGLSYPLIRSIQTNLTISVDSDYNNLNHNLNGVRYSQQRSRGVSSSLKFDHRDGWFGGGQTFGSMTLDLGQLWPTAYESEPSHVSKLVVDVSRQQSLFGPLSLFVNINRYTNANPLNDYHKTALGGVRGVRAYHSGESVGASGGHLQTELNYGFGTYQPFAFYDIGAIGAQTTHAGRTLSGYGLGMRIAQGRVQGAVSAAWKGVGGPDQSGTQQRTPRVWAHIKVSF
jgi:hemolysin activation/secretion protein